MTCSDFVARASEYIDGFAPSQFVREADEHLAACATCRRYRHVVESGAELLRSLPEPGLRDDFRRRLRHRLYHVDQDGMLRPGTSSGATVLSVTFVALLLGAVAWWPALRASAPLVEMAPIVVDRPPAFVRALELASRSGRQPVPVQQAGLWDDGPALLFQHSVLSQRYARRSPLQRAGLEQNR
jgi:anti-sigma factor RsiW